jgi:ankyrin repeat protein
MRERANEDVRGRTPLMLAAFEGNLPAVQRLLAEGADVNSRDEAGDTALMFAAFKGHAAVVYLLLLHGANVHARARNGWTARKAARSGFHTEIEAMLSKAEAEDVEGAMSYVC